MPFHTPRPSNTDRIASGAVAGMAGIAAWLAVQEVDRRLLKHDTNDLILIGRPLTAKRSLVEPVGLGVHLMNGAIVGGVYSRTAHDRLPGPPAVRGMTFLVAENVVLYPLALLEDHHPGIIEGSLARYWNWTAFFQQTIRHIAFGVVLGTLTGRWLRR